MSSAHDSKPRPPRLTEAEWAGLWDAVMVLQGEAEDTDDPDRWRALRAAERALAKIHRHGLAPRNKKGTA